MDHLHRKSRLLRHSQSGHLVKGCYYSCDSCPSGNCTCCSCCVHTVFQVCLSGFTGDCEVLNPTIDRPAWLLTRGDGCVYSYVSPDQSIKITLQLSGSCRRNFSLSAVVNETVCFATSGMLDYTCCASGTSGAVDWMVIGGDPNPSAFRVTMSGVNVFNNPMSDADCDACRSGTRARPSGACLIHYAYPGCRLIADPFGSPEICDGVYTLPRVADNVYEYESDWLLWCKDGAVNQFGEWIWYYFYYKQKLKLECPHCDWDPPQWKLRMWVSVKSDSGVHCPPVCGTQYWWTDQLVFEGTLTACDGFCSEGGTFVNEFVSHNVMACRRYYTTEVPKCTPQGEWASGLYCDIGDVNGTGEAVCVPL